MAPIVAENAVQVSFGGTYGTRNWAHVVGGFITGTGTAEGLARDIVQSYLDNVMPVLASSVNLSTARYVDLRTLDGDSGPISGLTGFPASGGGGDNGAPPNVTYLLRLEISGGRASRNGRMYLPGVNEAEVNGFGVIDSEQVDGLNIATGNFFTDITAGDNGYLGVLGKTSTGSYLMRSVIDVNVDTKVATQRRRLRK